MSCCKRQMTRKHILNTLRNVYYVGLEYILMLYISVTGAARFKRRGVLSDEKTHFFL